MCAKKRNAVAGVGARNGADQTILREKIRRKDRATCPPLTSALTAVLDHRGTVLSVLAGRSAARAFLRGGCA